MNIGNKLRGLRISHNITPYEIATQIGVSESTYRRYEQGKTKIDIKVIDKIAEIFGIDYNDLLGEDNNTILQTKDEHSIDINQDIPKKNDAHTQKLIEQFEARIQDLKEEIEILKDEIGILKKIIKRGKY